MNNYSKEQVDSLEDQRFHFIEVSEYDHVLKIVLNREKKRNALHPQMVNEIAFAMHYAHFNSDIWMIVFGAKGKVFCAGADLKAMAGFAEPHESTVPKPTNEILIGELFNKVHKPTIAVVTGDVYAGGFFLLAGSNIVIAQDNVKFGLPEVKRGLYPFQVMSALLRVMPARKVLDWCIRGYNLPVGEAERYGLVSMVLQESHISEALAGILEQLKANSPKAISKGLEAYDHIQSAASDHAYLHKMLMETIGSKDGQEGLAAFREKRKPKWSGE